METAAVAPLDRLTRPDNVAAVNLKAGTFILDDGSVCKITNLFDLFGQETTNHEEARSAVGQLPSGRWAAIDLREFTGRPH